jgi:hypothetical protein
MGIERSPKSQKRQREWEKRFDKRAKRKSGPVVVRYVCPVCGGAHAKKDCTND